MYVEVHNFASRQVGTYWETCLASTLEFRGLGFDGDPNFSVPQFFQNMG